MANIAIYSPYLFHAKKRLDQLLGEFTREHKNVQIRRTEYFATASATAITNCGNWSGNRYSIITVPEHFIGQQFDVVYVNNLNGISQGQIMSDILPYIKTGDTQIRWFSVNDNY